MVKTIFAEKYTVFFLLIAQKLLASSRKFIGQFDTFAIIIFNLT